MIKIRLVRNTNNREFICWKMFPAIPRPKALIGIDICGDKTLLCVVGNPIFTPDRREELGQVTLLVDVARHASDTADFFK